MSLCDIGSIISFVGKDTIMFKNTCIVKKHEGEHCFRAGNSMLKNSKKKTVVRTIYSTTTIDVRDTCSRSKPN